MHYKLEIVMPPTDNIEKAIDTILEPFSEHDEDARHPFWDWYVIGGRWSGSKVKERIGEDVLTAFYQWCRDEGVTVSNVQWGKQSLMPEDQIPKVDAKWQELTGLEGPCLIFQHSGDSNDGDICTVKDLPEGYTAAHVIVASHENEAFYMVEDDIWNGVNHVKADWDGTVHAAIAAAIERAAYYKDEYREKSTPNDNWLVVTVDYHS
jgi:hypothetical protein